MPNATAPFKLEQSELSTLIFLAQKSIWADRAQRDQLQRQGVNLTPVNFYANTPSISEILSSFEYAETAPYLDASIFNAESLRDELAALQPFTEDFTPAQEGDERNGETFFWKNSQFSYSDAMSYHAFIRRLKPRTIVEIGSGYSSLIAAEALRRNGFGRLKCIEPFPRPFIKSMNASGELELYEATAQSISPATLNSMLDDGDVLFIDSTHTVKSGSDCLHIYLRLLPQITKKIHVHIHDIFLPFGMPQPWLLDSQIFWTEQYLLLAWMIGNPRIVALYGSAYHHHFNPDLLESLMRGRYSRGGSSFWLKYDGSNSGPA